MDNSTATKPYSKLKGDAYRAYEALPLEVRRALQESLVDWCPLRAREWLIHLQRHRGLPTAQAAAALVQTIRRQDHAEVLAFARSWPKGAEAYPHLAAGATIQRYAGAQGLPAAEPVPLAPPAVRAPSAAKPQARAKPRSQAKPKPRAKPKSSGKRKQSAPAKGKQARRARR